MPHNNSLEMTSQIPCCTQHYNIFYIYFLSRVASRKSDKPVTNNCLKCLSWRAGIKKKTQPFVWDKCRRGMWGTFVTRRVIATLILLLTLAQKWLPLSAIPQEINGVILKYIWWNWTHVTADALSVSFVFLFFLNNSLFLLLLSAGSFLYRLRNCLD